ncbi:hypothetical protein K2173_008527 [Erythroxylum novogranatense]|uniref:Uncharacterized protein n=1 Tax=Erythroxylum novogranatense TaxID=1862640 RepID=A0AAV8SKL1_9ROSI|nr:hypothetical protein K2173_008527 [Erythroxylum novogranatense]
MKTKDLRGTSSFFYYLSDAGIGQGTERLRRTNPRCGNSQGAETKAPRERRRSRRRKKIFDLVFISIAYEARRFLKREKVRRAVEARGSSLAAISLKSIFWRKLKRIVASASMMSTLDLELIEFINPELTWKTVAKRYRSCLRRTRRSIDRKYNMGSELLDDVPNKADATLVSDTEKHGVAVLGCRFGEEIEHGPIKKRRLMAQSTSLTSQCPLPYFEVPELNLNSKAHSRKSDTTPKATDATSMISETNYSQFENVEDFSGIEILAAVACNNSLFKNIDLVEECSLLEEPIQEGAGSSSTSAVVVEETASYPKDKMEAPSVVNNSTSISPTCSARNDTRAKKSESSTDDRLPFDLNNVPCKNVKIDFLVDCSHNVSIHRNGKLQNLGPSDNQQEHKEISQSHPHGLVCSSMHTDEQSSVDMKGLTSCTNRSSTEDHKIEQQLDDDYRNIDLFVSSPSCIIQEPSTSDFADVKTSSKFVKDPSDESNESNSYQTDHVTKVVTGNTSGLQDGYDSQFEDGELRESDPLFCWDDSELEDWGVEQLDYGSEFEEKGFSGLDCGKEMKVVRGPSPGTDNVIRVENSRTVDSRRDDSASTGTRTLNVTTDKDCSSKAGLSVPLSMEELSNVEGPDAIRFKDDIPLQNRDAAGDTSKKLLERDRITYNFCAQSPDKGRFANHPTRYWDADQRYSLSSRSPYCFCPPRPRSAIEGRGWGSDYSEPEDTWFFSCNHRQFMNSSTCDGYEHNMRRFPVIRNYNYTMDTRRLLPVRDFVPTRSKFKRYRQELGRGIREEYNRLIPEETPECPNHLPHWLPKRDRRSISPLSRGQYHYGLARRKSPPRSRCLSPATYALQREQNVDSRCQSRSLVYGSDARAERLKLPFQKRFAATYEDSYKSPTRNRFSSHHSSKWYDERNGALPNYRGRKSPTKMSHESRWFSYARPTLKSDSYNQFSPRRHSRKFSEMGDGGR